MNRLSSATSKFMPLALALAPVVLVVLSYISGIGFLDLLELKTYDMRLHCRGVLPPSHNIVLCVIDEKSLRREGRWPWPRWKIANLVNTLSEKGAKVIAFDIGFFEPDEYVDLSLLEELKTEVKKGPATKEDLVSLLERIKNQFNNDLILARSIRDSKARIVLGYFFQMSREDMEDHLDHDQLTGSLSLIEASRYPIVLYKRHGSHPSPFPKAFVPVTNLEQLTEAADSTGYFNIFPDPDGVVRRIPLAIECDGGVYSPLSIQALWNALDRPPLSVVVSGYRVEGIRIGQKFIPTDAKGNLLINYLGPPKTFPHISVSDILRGDVDDDILKDSIAFVGATAQGIYDQRASPVSPVYPGLEVHATVADNILTGHYILKPKWSIIVDLLSICMLGLLSALLLQLLGPLRGVFVCAGLFATYVGACIAIFWSRGIWLNIIYPAISLGLTYGLITIYYYVTQEKDRKRLNVAFRQYVSPLVAKQLLRKPNGIRIGGQKKVLTVLFSDLQGFSKLLKDSSPEKLISQLNEYQTVMTDIVFKWEGTIDKYMGDGLMAIFGAPLSIANHAHKACEAALEMIEALKHLNRQWITTGKSALDIGIGISSGPMLVGNLGSRQRFNYTAIGESVNLGAKLGRLSSYYNINILISEPTYHAVKDKLFCVEIDTIRQCEGKTATIYCLVGREVPPEQQQALNMFSMGLRFYKLRQWKKAAEIFYNARKADPELRVAEIYFRRCKYFIKNPPPPEWDGIWNRS